MIDLSEAAREHAERVRTQVRLAPVAEVIAAGRRRRHRRSATLAAAVATFVVVAAGALFVGRPSNPAPPDAAPAPTTDSRSIVLDRGALTIEPVEGVTPAYDEAYARAAADQVIWPAIGPTTRIVLGKVRSSLAPRPGGYDGTVAPTSWNLAWVLFSTEVSIHVCVPIALPHQTPAGPPGTAAVIVDATTGVASAYQPNHTTCFGWTQPTLEPAHAMYSVPFEVDADGTFTVRLPPCGKSGGANQGPVLIDDQIVPLAANAVQYTASVRIGPCHEPATTFRRKPPDVRAPYGHAPTGQFRRTPDGVVLEP